MKKINFKKKGNLKKGKKFWNTEYDKKSYLKISDKHSSDLEKFYRWLERFDDYYLPVETDSILDIGCGNGRNIIFSCKKFKCKGTGYDISSQAVKQAKDKAQEEGLTINFFTQNASEAIPLEDGSQKVILDIMVSHVLKKQDRLNLIKEIHRVTQEGCFLFFKTFLLDGDLNAMKLLKKYPGSEEGSYIHPKIGIEEHVFTEDGLIDDLSLYFKIHKIYKSHKHLDKQGRANKRRSIMMYCQKK